MNTQCSLRFLIGTDQTQMVTVEVDLKEGDKQPEQQLDDGEHIERVVVPLSELYDKLQGKFPSPFVAVWREDGNPWFLALSKEDGKIVDARYVHSQPG